MVQIFNKYYVLNIKEISERNRPEKNFVFSPYSIHKLLSVLLLGSQGNTRKELQKVLHVDDELINFYPYSKLGENESCIIKILNKRPLLRKTIIETYDQLRETLK